MQKIRITIAFKCPPKRYLRCIIAAVYSFYTGSINTAFNANHSLGYLSLQCIIWYPCNRKMQKTYKMFGEKQLATA